jgi:hypothetical protein
MLQFLDFLLILSVDLRVPRKRFFQLLDSLVLVFDLLAESSDQVFQLVELLVVNRPQCPDRQHDHQSAAHGGAS